MPSRNVKQIQAPPPFYAGISLARENRELASPPIGYLSRIIPTAGGRHCHCACDNPNHDHGQKGKKRTNFYDIYNIPHSEKPRLDFVNMPLMSILEHIKSRTGRTPRLPPHLAEEYYGKAENADINNNSGKTDPNVQEKTSTASPATATISQQTGNPGDNFQQASETPVVSQTAFINNGIPQLPNNNINNNGNGNGSNVVYLMSTDQSGAPLNCLPISGNLPNSSINGQPIFISYSNGQPVFLSQAPNNISATGVQGVQNDQGTSPFQQPERQQSGEQAPPAILPQGNMGISQAQNHFKENPNYAAPTGYAATRPNPFHYDSTVNQEMMASKLSEMKKLIRQMRYEHCECPRKIAFKDWQHHMRQQKSRRELAKSFQDTPESQPFGKPTAQRQSSQNTIMGTRRLQSSNCCDKQYNANPEPVTYRRPPPITTQRDLSYLHSYQPEPSRLEFYRDLNRVLYGS